MGQRLSLEAIWAWLKRPKVLRCFFVAILSISGIGALAGLGAYFGVRALYRKFPSQIVRYEMDTTAMAKLLTPVSVRSDPGEFEIPIQLPKSVRLTVPINKVLDVPIKEVFRVPVDMKVRVPVDQEVFVKTEFPLDLTVPVDGVRLKARVFGIPAIPVILQGSLPLKLTVPVERAVRIKTDIEVPIRRVFEVPFQKTLKVPLDFNLNLDFPIQRLIQIRFDGPLKLKVRIDEEMPVRAQFGVVLTKDGRIVVGTPQSKGKEGGESTPPP